MRTLGGWGGAVRTPGKRFLVVRAVEVGSLHFVELVDRVAKLLLEVADTVKGIGQGDSMAWSHRARMGSTDNIAGLSATGRTCQPVVV